MINMMKRVRGEDLVTAASAGARRAPAHGRRWMWAGLGAVAAAAVAAWAMVMSWSVHAPSWWEEAPPRLAGAVVLVAGVVVWIRLPSPRTGQLIVLGSVLYYAQFFRAADGALFAVGF